jgi:hypothetical protein
VKQLQTFFFLFFTGVSGSLVAQYSIATDGSFLRNFSSHQKFLVFGQTVLGNFYINKKEALYVSVSYYTNGSFKNKLTAIAKDSALPAQIPYTINSSLRYRQFSSGWKHYFKGSYNAEDGWSVYGVAGFGLLLGRAQNSFNKSIDTALYKIQYPLAGKENFKRLTFDTALGVETPLGTAIFLYGEARSWLASSHYPSPYLYRESYELPTAVSLNIGLRILIE